MIEGHPAREWPSISSVRDRDRDDPYGFLLKSTVGASFAASVVTSK